jgi:hypothetical protein
LSGGVSILPLLLAKTQINEVSMTKVKTEEGVIVEFKMEPVELPYESERQNRPIFEDREFITIIIPGDNNSEVVREVTKNDRERFAREYEAWKKNEAVASSGTPLEELTWLSPSKVRELKAVNVYTLEDLAGLSDTIIQKLGTGGRSFVDKAKAHLRAAEGGAVASELQQQLRDAKADNERLKEQMTELNARFEELAKAKPKAA